MIGTYAAVLAVCASSLAIGQAAIALCGWRRWSWLAPSAGLALLVAFCWGTVRLPGDGAFSASGILALTVASSIYLRGRLAGVGEELRAGWPVALLALLACSLPFAVEGHFGILGTGFNPDMSQHLLATDRLAGGHSSQLLAQGYPLGPHAVVVALHQGLGIGLVQGFSGLTVAVAILASLTALAALAELRPVPRTAGALLVGLTYLVASYFAQGAFKETMQALFLLAFVLALREADRSWSDLPLRLVPAALIAAGSLYAYSFPSLIWLGAAFSLWALANAASPAGGADGGSSPPGEEVPSATGPAGKARGLAPAALGLTVFALLTLPELGRMVDFANFETFDPNGPGLGNLFGQVSPVEALGIWPSGDFRLAPGDGAVPAIAFYLGIAFALALFLRGVAHLWRGRETAILSGLAAAALGYLAARVAGTPYTAAKAIEIAAPLVALTIVLPLGKAAAVRFITATRGKGTPLSPALLLGAAFALAAGACSLLALANAPVGPTTYSSALSGYRKVVGAGPTVVFASPRLLDEEHGEPFLAWELRGGRVCVRYTGEAVPPGARFVIRDEGGWKLSEVRDPLPGKSPCPLIAVRQARQGPAR